MKIGNVKLQDLKEKYGTPLYIYDEDHLLKNISLFKSDFKSNLFDTEVIYASKAFCVKEMIRLIKKTNLSLDCVSKGEIYTALSVGFDPKKIYFHGNNKTYDDLIYALENNIGYIVLDNLSELELLEELCISNNYKTNVLIRLNVGVSAHTHKFIVTAHIDSKFGVLFDSCDYKKMEEILKKSKNITFKGFHSHIGSQIFDLKSFTVALEKLISYCKKYDNPLILNIGGGYGVKYTSDDSPIPFNEVSKYLVCECEKLLVNNNLKLEKLCIEPGRSIVAEAGYTLYTIGHIKKTPNKQYYLIDGGMTENNRPALYQAKYDCDVVGKDNKTELVTIAGKCCESGDLIIEDIMLPKANPNDLLLVYSTGAYGYSMSSNYNKALTPAVVFVSNGDTKLVCKRQTYEELIEREE